MEERNNQGYKAFISYRHKPLDKTIAKRVHSSIEHYLIPRGLRVSPDDKRLGKVFRDEEELPASGSLSDNIRYAIENSEYLIVICSPDTPESHWVREEIRYFRRLHGSDHIIAVLVDGIPDESFPPELTEADVDGDGEIKTVIEPLASNITDEDHHYDKQRFRREVVRIYAALIGCSYDELWQREHRYRLRRTFLAVGAAFAVVTAFGISMYVKNLQISERNRQIEEQNADIQKKNDEIISQSEQITGQNKELQIREADTLLREAELLYSRGDVYEAADRVVDAMASEEGMAAYGCRAEYLLNRFLGIGSNYDRLRTVRCMEQESDVKELRLTDDGKNVITLDAHGIVRCFDCDTGELKWDTDASMGRYYNALYSPEKKRLLLSKDNSTLICYGRECISALSMIDGTIRWRHLYDEDSIEGNGSEFVCMNEDGTELAVIDSYESESSVWGVLYSLDFISCESGEIIKSFALPDFFIDRKIRVYGNDFGVYAPDGQSFGGVFHSGRFYTPDMIHCFIVDFEKKELRLASDEYDAGSSTLDPFILGSFIRHTSEGEWILYALCYDPGESIVEMNTFSYNENEIKTVYKYDSPFDFSDLGYHSFQSDFRTDEVGRMIAVCGPIEFTLIPEGDVFRTTMKTIGSDIVRTVFPFESESESWIRLLKDGTFRSSREGGFTGWLQFMEYLHIDLMDITPDFAAPDDTRSYTVLPDTVAVVVTDDNKNKINVLNTDKDGMLGTIAVNRGEKASKLYRIDDRVFSIYTYDSILKQASIILIDSVSDEVIGEYEAGSEDGSLFYYDQIKFWTDSVHFSINKKDRGEVRIVNMITGEVTPFSSEDHYGKQLSNICDCRNGICAAIVDRVDNTLTLLDKDLVEETIPINTDDLNQNITPESISIGDNGLLIIPLSTEDGRIKCFYVYDIKDSQTYLIESGSYENDPGEHFIVAGNGSNAFADICDSNLYLYDTEQDYLKKQIKLDLSYHNVLNAQIFNEDRCIAIWTQERELLVYDMLNGRKVFDEYMDLPTDDSSDVYMSLTENKETKRAYVSFSDYRGICLDMENFSKTMDIPSIEYYSVGADTIYLYCSSDELFYYHPYSLSELIDRAKGN